MRSAQFAGDVSTIWHRRVCRIGANDRKTNGRQYIVVRGIKSSSCIQAVQMDLVKILSNYKYWWQRLQSLAIWRFFVLHINISRFAKCHAERERESDIFADSFFAFSFLLTLTITANTLNIIKLSKIKMSKCDFIMRSRKCHSFHCSIIFHKYNLFICGCLLFNYK